MKKIAIIGASYLQVPLILKAKKMGLETHVFAWQVGDEGERIADYFYPISIIEKEEILNKCKEIGIDGICSISSDLATITVNYVANNMGLIGNSIEATKVSTDKHAMRETFERCGDPSPWSIQVTDDEDFFKKSIAYKLPLIVKPVDRSGSRGITLISDISELKPAIEKAKEQGFKKVAVVEEYATGQEYSVECISWEGRHTFLALTKKYTTGAPSFIETAHIEPAGVTFSVVEKVKSVVFHALDSLQLRYGASHSEIKIDADGNIKIIEIGGRMGGDNIGSSLVPLSTGYDFVKNVINVSLGIEPEEYEPNEKRVAAIRYIFNNDDLSRLQVFKSKYPTAIIEENVEKIDAKEITDSASRFGYYIMTSDISAPEFIINQLG